MQAGYRTDTVTADTQRKTIPSRR